MWLVLRIITALISLIFAFCAVAVSCIEFGNIFDSGQNTPSRKKKIQIAYRILFFFFVFTGCLFEIWSFAAVIINHSILDLILAIAYIVLLAKL